MIGDDVALRAGLDAADGQHGWFTRLHLPGDHRLQAHDDHGGQHDRVDRGLWHRAVGASPVDRDPHAVGSREDRADPRRHDPRGHRQHVLAQGHRGGPDQVGEAVVHHPPRAVGHFLGRLEDGHERAGPGLRRGCEEIHGTQQAGHVHVVPACVHHRALDPVGVAGDHRAGVVKTGCLLHGEGVHVGAQEHGRPVAVLQDPDHARAADVLVDGAPALPESLCDVRGGPGLLVRQLRMCVQVAVEVLDPPARRWETREYLSGGVPHGRTSRRRCCLVASSILRLLPGRCQGPSECSRLRGCGAFSPKWTPIIRMAKQTSAAAQAVSAP